MSDPNRILALSRLAQNGIQKVKEGTEMGKIGDISIPRNLLWAEKKAPIQLTSAHTVMSRTEEAAPVSGPNGLVVKH